MPPSTWKRVELAICKLFGGVRSGPVGKDGPDCNGTGHYAVQVKHRTCPKWLIDAMEQAVRDAGLSELPVVALHPTEEMLLLIGAELPVVALHPKHAAIDDTLIIFRLKDFKAWHL